MAGSRLRVHMISRVGGWGSKASAIQHSMGDITDEEVRPDQN